jgi:hypothetical protein
LSLIQAVCRYHLGADRGDRPLRGRIVASGLCGWCNSLCSSRIACKKEHRRSSCTNALPSNDASPLEVPAAQNPNRMASSIYGSSRGCIWRRVEGADFASATPFVGLALPIRSTHHSIYHLKIGCRYPFRKPLQFIVITVMSVMRATFPDTYGGFYMTVNCWCIRGSSWRNRLR